MLVGDPLVGARRDRADGADHADPAAAGDCAPRRAGRARSRRSPGSSSCSRSVIERGGGRAVARDDDHLHVVAEQHVGDLERVRQHLVRAASVRTGTGRCRRSTRCARRAAGRSARGSTVSPPRPESKTPIGGRGHRAARSRGPAAAGGPPPRPPSPASVRQPPRARARARARRRRATWRTGRARSARRRRVRRARRRAGPPAVAPITPDAFTARRARPSRRSSISARSVSSTRAAGAVVRGERAGRGTSPPVAERDRRCRAALRRADAGLPPTRRIAGRGPRAVDDGRLDPDPARDHRRARGRRRRRDRRGRRRRWSGSPGRSGWPTARRRHRRRRGSSASASGWSGTRRPTVSTPTGDRVGDPRRLARTTTVSGPGQQARASSRRRVAARADAHSGRSVGVAEVHDDGMIRRAALHREQPAHRGG